MKTMTKKIVLFVCSICLVLGMMLSLSLESQAVSEGQKARVVVENFSVSNDAIVPGEEFELKMLIRNTSKTDTAKSILMTFTNDLNTVYTVYGQTDQMYISELKPKGTKEITVNLKAAEELMDSTVRFEVDFVYEDYITSQNLNSSSIQLPVTTTSKFEVQNVSFPDTIYAGEKSRIRITYKNTGADDFYNITMNVASEGTEEDEQYSLGSLVAGKVSYAELYITLEEVGSKEVSIRFSYEDIEGNKFNTEEYKQTVNVMENQEEGATETEEPQNVTVSKSYDLYLLIAGIIAMAVVTWILYRKYEK